MYMLEHISEDFDDDLLQDTINLLVDECWTWMINTDQIFIISDLNLKIGLILTTLKLDQIYHYKIDNIIV